MLAKLLFRNLALQLLIAQSWFLWLKEQSFLPSGPAWEQSWQGRPPLTWSFSLCVNICFQQPQAGYLHKPHRPGNCEGFFICLKKASFWYYALFDFCLDSDEMHRISVSRDKLGRWSWAACQDPGPSQPYAHHALRACALARTASAAGGRNTSPTARSFGLQTHEAANIVSGGSYFLSGNPGSCKPLIEWVCRWVRMAYPGTGRAGKAGWRTEQGTIWEGCMADGERSR